MIFITHDGKSMPVAEDDYAITKLRSGMERRTNAKKYDNWLWSDESKSVADIVGYFIPESTDTKGAVND